ncbi:hypothetical protein HK096_008493 [Nowakowskiella sp. JEL0078]|nr:hypothetical protein HK096_008493 [Nowakowskiella sp. JEL0078]
MFYIHAIKIQCFIRKCFAIRRVRQMRKDRDERIAMLVSKEKRRKELGDKKKKMEIESRLHPRTTKDFEILYNGLENWRIQQSDIINNTGYSEAARLAALANLLDQESELIQKIGRLKIAANEENREKAIIRLLDQMSSPKKWSVSKPIGSFTSVDTPNTIRARELKDLYHALNIPLLSVDERLQILLHVKYTVKEFDCNLTREIVELIDREGDLVSRGRDPKSLEEFNPEAALYQKFPDAGQSWKRDQAVYYCRGCTKYHPSTRFYLSTTIRQLGKCKACMLKENVATQRKDDSCYADMLQLVRMQEHQKRIANQTKNTYNNETNTSIPIESEETAMMLLQESDMRYIVDIIWNHQSAISASHNIDELVLTRWDPRLDLSPWNCILLTRTEAVTHDRAGGGMAAISGTSAFNKIYSEEFVAKIHQKHIAARQHFAQLPAMERHLKLNYLDKI